MIGNLVDFFKGRYTIGELMNIDPGRQQRSQDCSVELVDTFFSVKDESLSQKFRSFFSSTNVKIFYITIKLKVTSSSGKAHNVLIQLEPDFSLHNWTENKVRVFCDCADFKYRSAYGLKSRDSLFINDYTKLMLGQSLTDSPKSSTSRTTLCKHTYAALIWILNNYTNLMYSL